MQLKKLEVKNFRSLKSVVYDFENSHNIYTGKNGSGKSHVLECLNDFLTREITLFKDKVDSNKTLKIAIIFELGQTDLNLLNNGNLILGQNKLELEFNKGKIKQNITLNKKKINLEKVRDIHEYVKSFFNVIYSTPFSYIDINKDKRLIESISEKIENEKPGVVSDILSGPYNVKVELKPEINILKLELDKKRSVKECNTGALRDVHLEIYRKMYKNNKKKTIFIYDEFETHYHPQMTLSQYYKTVQEYDLTFISTHCTELINALLMDLSIAIYFVSNNASNLIKSREKLSKVLSSTKVNSKLIFSNYIVFVEGRFDTYFIDKVFGKLGVINKVDFDIFELSGCNNHKDVQAFMADNKLKNYIFLLDQDARYSVRKNVEVSDNIKLKNELVKSLTSSLNLEHEETLTITGIIENQFSLHAHKSKKSIIDEHGYPIYETKPKFSKAGAASGHYLLHEYDLETSIIDNKRGRHAIKYVMSNQYNSINEINVRDSKVIKKNIIQVTDRYATTINSKDELPEIFNKLYDKIIKFNR